MQDIAIIGAGPAGLAAAKYLIQHGFNPTIFEQGDSVGGQWSGGAAHSGVWPSMRTNTSRLMTAFSDFPHGDDVAVYPSNREMHAYLLRYVQRYGLNACLRLRTRVTRLERHPSGDGWRLSYTGEGGAVQSEVFARVVVASGRYNKPSIPAVAGIESFSGAGAVSHTFGYRGPGAYRGMRVLVAGGSISALEIASDLAVQEAGTVISSQRKQRYVLSKLIAGVPVEHLAFTRFAALAAESLPLDAVARSLKDFIVDNCGRPEQYGALAVSENVLEAGITQNQSFLPLVAEGRILPKPWISEIRGRSVRFSDGTTDEADALIFGTGFDLHLPFLAEESRRHLDLDSAHIDLYARTLHPELPGLAFLGLYDIVGPAFPVLELQARWLAYLWSGIRPEPSSDEMREGIAAYQATRHLPASVPMHALAVLFARLAGAEPSVEEFPQLARALLFGPLSPESFRLTGPDRLTGALERTERAAALFGAVPEPSLTAEQRMQLAALAAARDDEGLARVAAPQAGDDWKGNRRSAGR